MRKTKQHDCLSMQEKKLLVVKYGATLTVPFLVLSCLPTGYCFIFFLPMGITRIRLPILFVSQYQSTCFESNK